MDAPDRIRLMRRRHEAQGEAVEVEAADCLDVMADMGDDSVDLVLTDPRWNLGRAYGAHNDRLSLDRYGHWLNVRIAQCVRVAAVGVVLCPGRGHAGLARLARGIELEPEFAPHRAPAAPRSHVG
jgi:hypothetical protein